MDAAAACMCSDKEKDSVRALQSPLEKNTQVQLQSKINLPTEFETAMVLKQGERGVTVHITWPEILIWSKYFSRLL